MDTSYRIKALRTHEVIFDSSDIDYMVTHLTTTQLKQEIRQSNLREYLAKISYDITCEVFERDYQAACELAVMISRSVQSIPAPACRGPIDVDALKSSIDIVVAASRYTKLVKSGNNFKGLCPFHNERNPSFYVYSQRQTWRCFGACSTGGDVISLVMKAENTDFITAISILRSMQ